MSAIHIQWPSHTVSVGIRSEYALSLSVCLFSRKGPNLPENPAVIYVPHCLPEAATSWPSSKRVQFSKALIAKCRQNVPLLTALISVVLLLAYAPWHS